MLTTGDLAQLDELVLRRLRTGEERGLEVVGAGEMTCVLAWRGHACKRLPPFRSSTCLDAYRTLMQDYLLALNRAGVETLSTALISFPREQHHVAYLVQPNVAPELCLPEWIRNVDRRRGLDIVRKVLDSAKSCVALGVGIDATLPNWVVRDDEPVYLDVSTPMLRNSMGEDRLDTEIFVATLPALFRGLARRFLVPELLARHFETRSIYLDLVADLINTGLSNLIGTLLAEANRRLEFGLTISELRRHHRQEWLRWRAIRLLLRMEQVWRRRVLGVPWAHLLPSDFNQDPSSGTSSWRRPIDCVSPHTNSSSD